MKNGLLFLLLMLACSGFAQQNATELIEFVISKPPRQVEKYNPTPKKNTLILKTAFNNAIFEDVKLLNGLKDKTIIKIELVYTTYRKNESFDQHGLNRKRLTALFNADPGILKQGGIDWELVAQTGCTSAEMGKEFLHGVVVTYRDNPSAVKTFLETKFLTEVAEGTVPYYAYDAFMKAEEAKIEYDSLGAPILEKPHKITEASFPGGKTAAINYYSRNLKFPATPKEPVQVLVEFEVNPDGKIQNIKFPADFKPTAYTDEVLRFLRAMPDWQPGTLDGTRTTTVVQQAFDFLPRGSAIPSPPVQYPLDLPPKKEAKIPGVDYTKIKPAPGTKQVIESFRRIPPGKTALVVDVTGSMAQYSAQVLEYLKGRIAEKDTNLLRITFFNDGDKKSDKQKKIGETGGIYQYPITTTDELLNHMVRVMEAGNGGDLPENNVEAILRTLDSCSECHSIILIADNFATPRDMALLAQVKVPVYSIVCASGGVLNENYLTLAYKTKGSVQIAGKEFKNLHTYEEGATVQVGKETYILVKGRFVRRSK